MKQGTIEYTIKTERQFEKIQGRIVGERTDSEYWEKAKGYDSEGSFDPENHNSELVEKIRQEHARLLSSNPNILKYESRIVEKLPLPEVEIEDEENKDEK